MLDWFHNKAVPKISKYQMEDLKIPADEVKAIILLDNAPVHPYAENLSRWENQVHVYLPPNTTSLIQPMYQGVIYMAKRLYKKVF